MRFDSGMYGPREMSYLLITRVGLPIYISCRGSTSIIPVFARQKMVMIWSMACLTFKLGGGGVDARGN